MAKGGRPVASTRANRACMSQYVLIWNVPVAPDYGPREAFDMHKLWRERSVFICNAVHVHQEWEAP
jgi:hypothetical protein